MSDSLFVEGAESLAWRAPKRAREALVDARVNTQAKRAAVAALPAAPWSKDLVRKIGTRAISSTASRPFLTDISSHLRQTIFEL